MTVFSALWLCQSLLILGHSALNLNILPKSKLINQRNAGLGAHFFSHIKQVREGKKTPHRNKTKVSTLTVGFLCAKCSQQLGSVFFCIKERFLVCHGCLPLPQNTSWVYKHSLKTPVQTCSFITASYVSYRPNFPLTNVSAQGNLDPCTSTKTLLIAAFGLFLKLSWDPRM